MGTFIETFIQADGTLGSPWFDDTIVGGPGHMVLVHSNRAQTVSDTAWYTALTQPTGSLPTTMGDWQIDFDCFTSDDVGGGGVMVRLLNPADGTGYGVFVGNAIHAYKFDGVGGESYFTNWSRPGEGDGLFTGCHVTMTHTAAGHFEMYRDGGQGGGGAGLSNADDTSYTAGNFIVLGLYSNTSPTNESWIDNLVVKDSIGSPTPGLYRSKVVVPNFAAQRASQW